MKLASFDIFDTALIRKCGQPENVFYLLAWRLFPDDRALREDFLLWRRNAERRARKRCPGTDISLAQIYECCELSELCGISLPKMQDAEKQIESENLIANPFVKNLINQKRSEGYDICFISDMYLDSRFLTEVLRREGCLQNHEKVYVSCEYNARKSEGSLFDLIRSEQNPKEWCHYGDHRISDLKIPERKGIKAIRVNTPFSETEEMARVAAKTICDSYELSILAGLQRATRILNGDNAYIKIAADFIAPAYIPYLFFVLNQAQKRGLKRLYFLSRDSYILMKMAKSLQGIYSDIEFRYLFVSRKSLLMPYLKDATIEQFLAVQDHHTIYKKEVDTLLSSLGTDRKELGSDFGISFHYRVIANKQEELDFLSKIFNEESRYLPVLKQRISDRYSLLCAYFDQEKLFDGTPAGMVDVGWLGTSRLMINSILKSAAATPAEFFYFGIRGDVFSSKYGVYQSFYRPEQLGTELTSLVENYYSASPYPSTIGYKKTVHGIVPLFTNNSQYKETPITDNNTIVASWIAKELGEMKLDFSAAFWLWARISIDAISKLSVKVDLEPFVRTADFDNCSFVRRLSFSELLALVCFGDHVTAFDRASLQLTVGRPIDRICWLMHQFTGRIRHSLYLKFGR